MIALKGPQNMLTAPWSISRKRSERVLLERDILWDNVSLLYAALNVQSDEVRNVVVWGLKFYSIPLRRRHALFYKTSELS